MNLTTGYVADLAFSLQSRHVESLVSSFVHLGLDGIWRTQTYRDTNEGNAAKNYQKVMWETRVKI